jgi:DNA mismatch endonuclease (patch repair protein)
VRLRSALHRDGLRFRKNVLLRVEGLAVRPDIVFPGRRVAVFVDGCFWHRCPQHGESPRSNVSYWEAKLARNAARDHAVNTALTAAGWRVVRIWEHTPVDDAVVEIQAVLAAAPTPDPVQVPRRPPRRPATHDSDRAVRSDQDTGVLPS